MHADLVGTGGLRLDRFGVDVLEELKATVTVWRLEHRDVGVVAIKADGSVGPLTTDRVTANDGEAEVGEKGDRCFEVANGDTDVLEFDGHELHATEPGRFAAVVEQRRDGQASGQSPTTRNRLLLRGRALGIAQIPRL